MKCKNCKNKIERISGFYRTVQENYYYEAECQKRGYHIWEIWFSDMGTLKVYCRNCGLIGKATPIICCLNPEPEVKNG